MLPVRIVCGGCKADLSVALEAPDTKLACPVCGTEVRVHAFPGLVRGGQAGVSPRRILVEGESACFFHDTNTAAATCDQCGRFLCSLCDLQAGEAHYCPPCFAHRAAAGEATAPRTVTRYDQVALSMALLPFLFLPATLFTAPATLYVVYKHWNQPAGIVHPHRKSVFLMAGIIASFQLFLWFVIAGAVLLGLFAAGG